MNDHQFYYQHRPPEISDALEKKLSDLASLLNSLEVANTPSTIPTIHQTANFITDTITKTMKRSIHPQHLHPWDDGSIASDVGSIIKTFEEPLHSGDHAVLLTCGHADWLMEDLQQDGELVFRML
jgi:hypothetical protein